MPLSRHFYSLDEVQAALLYSVTTSNTSEALFWCNELIISGCAAEAISTLFQSWIWSVNFVRLEWLIDAWNTLASNELTEQEILLATYKLSSIPFSKKDCSLWNILVLIASNPDIIPDTITRKTPDFTGWYDLELNDIELYFIRAMFQGKAMSAWWVSQYMNKERIWNLLYIFSKFCHNDYNNKFTICLDALSNYDKLLGYKSDDYDTVITCCAILILSIWGDQKVSSFKELSNEIDKHNVMILEELHKVIGRKDARAYSIPIMCLYGNTLRGTYTWQQNNLNQLHNIEKHLVGCPFWDETLMEYANIDNRKNIEWHSDNKMEEFYNNYFPDDIPDEWSKKEKLKSHGDGILQPGNLKTDIRKYIKNNIGRRSILAWNTSGLVNKILEDGKHITINNYSLETVIRNYKKNATISEENLGKLNPVRKVVVYN